MSAGEAQGVGNIVGRITALEVLVCQRHPIEPTRAISVQAALTACKDTLEKNLTYKYIAIIFLIIQRTDSYAFIL